MVLVLVDVEECLGVLGQADGGDTLCAGGDPVVLQQLFLSLGGVAQHADDVDACSTQGQELCTFGQVHYGLDQVVLLDESDAVLVGADVA